MASEPTPPTIDEELPAIDVRSVAVIWGEGNPVPDVSYSGCSPYEAIGMLRQGLRKLERDWDLPKDDDDDDD